MLILVTHFFFSVSIAPEHSDQITTILTDNNPSTCWTFKIKHTKSPTQVYNNKFNVLTPGGAISSKNFTVNVKVTNSTGSCDFMPFIFTDVGSGCSAVGQTAVIACKIQTAVPGPGNDCRFVCMCKYVPCHFRLIVYSELGSKGNVTLCDIVVNHL